MDKELKYERIKKMFQKKKYKSGSHCLLSLGQSQKAKLGNNILGLGHFQIKKLIIIYNSINIMM